MSFENSFWLKKNVNTIFVLHNSYILFMKIFVLFNKNEIKHLVSKTNDTLTVSYDIVLH